MPKCSFVGLNTGDIYLRDSHPVLCRRERDGYVDCTWPVSCCRCPLWKSNAKSLYFGTWLFLHFNCSCSDASSHARRRGGGGGGEFIGLMDVCCCSVYYSRVVVVLFPNAPPHLISSHALLYMLQQRCQLRWHLLSPRLASWSQDHLSELQPTLLLRFVLTIVCIIGSNRGASMQGSY